MNCQKACKKCDDGRPCERCVKYGLESTCRDSARKERRRSSKRGTYSSKSGEDGITDSSDDDYSSQGGSEGTPRMNFSDSKKRMAGKLSYPQYGATSPYWNGGSTKGARGFPIENERLSGSLLSIPKPTLNVGAPNSSYIKALGIVCTDMLVKLEEEDLPPAVIYKEWPPASDHYFENVRFDMDFNDDTLLKQPLPTQRILLPELLKASTNPSPDSSWPVILHGSSPINSDGENHHMEMMTPPETPVNHISIDNIKHLAPTVITLPVIANLAMGENTSKLLPKQSNHHQHFLPN